MERAYAARMDEWVAWEAVEGETLRDEGRFCFAVFVLLSLSFLPLFYKGSSYPEACAQRTAEDGGSPMFGVDRPRLGAHPTDAK
jgi:hypothetical protein